MNAIKLAKAPFLLILKEMKIASILILLLLLISCFHYTQIFEINSPDTIQSDDFLIFENDDLSIAYNFWAASGEMGFFIENKTDEALSVNLAKTHFIKNSYVYDYFDHYKNINIPPNTFRILTEAYPILETLIISEELDRFPKQFDEIEFNKNNTPLIFMNYITYNIKGEEKIIDNEFWLKKISNFKNADLKNLASPSKFYITYTIEEEFK